MKINVKETTMVRPAKDTPGGSLWLSEIDLFFPNIHNNSVHFFKTSMDTNPLSMDDITRILKQSLSEVLVHFYPGAGRLGKDENGRVQIECNAKGVTFVVAEADCTLDEMLDIGESGPVSKFRPLIQPVDYSQDISSFPLILVKVTYFKCGGMCLAVAQHHWAVDGSSAVQFINSWASMARGQPIDEPVHDRKWISNQALPSPKFDHPEYDTNAIFGHVKPNPVPVDISTAYLRISTQHIHALKEKANANAEKADAHGKKFSVYESLAAHLWRCACKARGHPDDQKTSLVFPVNARPRLCPLVPRGFYGNAIQMSAPSAFSGELLKETLSSTAGRLRKSINEKDNEYIRSGIAYLRDNKVIDGFSGRSSFRNPNLGVVSWSQMPMHAMDFGWGPPVYAAPASIRSEGKIYVLSASSKEDSLALYVCLETSHMELFKKTFYDI
ncbi:PREDICTED: shikimate O-hydroxycinnamoyltransferase-like [Tarenaya hassleriana]|uniref:shikimate O-hydroxycinnamoyltransferase-like n=1 Tax=Tarenaya hassleriana TaxID=28532 RepID=UPI00053C3663|nr:PREDICTED: shikimate O-hydroxycinnamoyltransferase-like [Tarenaya hassleriana]